MSTSPFTLTLCLLGIVLATNSIPVQAVWNVGVFSSQQQLGSMSISPNVAYQQAEVQSQTEEIQLAVRQLASSDVTVTIDMFSTSTCDSNTKVNTVQLVAGNCTSAVSIIAFSGPQDMAYIKVFCSVNGPVTTFGYSDSSCTNVVGAMRLPTYSSCRDYLQINCPWNSGDTPNLPNFPPDGHYLIDTCSSSDCSKSCVTSSYPPNTCRIIRDPSSVSLTSNRATCSNTDTGVTIQYFSDTTCTLLQSAGATTAGTCFGYGPASMISCPKGVPTATMPVFPTNSVITTYNCTDSGCSQNCTKHAIVYGVCQSLVPGYNKRFGSSIQGTAQYCSSSSRATVAAFTDSVCSASKAAFAVVSTDQFATCYLDGNTYTQITCAYSSSQPQLPSSSLPVTLAAYATASCSPPVSANFLTASGTCIQTASKALKVDCSTPSMPIVTAYGSSDCSTAAQVTATSVNGQCGAGMIVNCPGGSLSSAATISAYSIVCSVLVSWILVWTQHRVYNY